MSQRKRGREATARTTRHGLSPLCTHALHARAAPLLASPVPSRLGSRTYSEPSQAAGNQTASKRRGSTITTHHHQQHEWMHDADAPWFWWHPTPTTDSVHAQPLPIHLLWGVKRHLVSLARLNTERTSTSRRSSAPRCRAVRASACAAALVTHNYVVYQKCKLL